uniref:Uncharacterized protein n=1 Tax=Meloidogyne hapla TaxID=6305 RepID=A0A1I8B2Q2_MELHA
MESGGSIQQDDDTSILVTNENKTQLEEEIRSNIEHQKNIIENIKEKYNVILNKYFPGITLEDLSEPTLNAKLQTGAFNVSVAIPYILESSTNQGYGIYPPKALEPVEGYPKADHLGKHLLFDQNSHNLNNPLNVSNIHAGLKLKGKSQAMGDSPADQVYANYYKNFLKQPESLSKNDNSGKHTPFEQISHNFNNPMIGSNMQGGLKLNEVNQNLGQSSVNQGYGMKYPVFLRQIEGYPKAGYLGNNPSIYQNPHNLINPVVGSNSKGGEL